jgi:hypothetical protein
MARMVWTSRHPVRAAEWLAHHRDLGHHPEHSPTAENPDLVCCDCGGMWRILTPEQIRTLTSGRSRNKRREEPEAEAADLPPETWRDGKFDFNDYLIESIQGGAIEEIDDENDDED